MLFRYFLSLLLCVTLVSGNDSLQLLQEVASRTARLANLAAQKPDLYDDWKAQNLAYERLLDQVAEQWIHDLSGLADRYAQIKPADRLWTSSLMRKLISMISTDSSLSFDAQSFNQLFPDWNKPSEIHSLPDQDRLLNGIGLLNACYMQGSDYFPGWGYKRDGYNYYCGKEVSREFINSYWMNEKHRVSVNETTQLIMKLKAAEELQKLVPSIRLGEKSVLDIDGKLEVVIRVKFSRKMSIRTTTQNKYGTERVWVELFEGKSGTWPWDEVKYDFVGNTYAEIHGPTGSKIISEARPLNSGDQDEKDDNLESGPIIGGEIKVIDGVKYQLGYQLRYWETEVLGTSEGVVDQDYLPCQKHKVDVLKSKLAEFRGKIPDLTMESGDLHHHYDGQDILYRRVGFKSSSKFRIKRRWYNQRLREYFNIYRRRISGWFPNWERMQGKRQTEREWNMNTLAFKISDLGGSQCQSTHGNPEESGM